MLKGKWQTLLKRLRQEKYRKRLPVAALVLVFAVIGIALLARSFAATIAVVMEAESGTVGGKAGPGNGTGASGGASILFGTTTNPGSTTGLNDPVKAEIAMQLVGTAENSTKEWYNRFSYIEWNVEGVENENRGYTAGIVGFCSGTGDMIMVMKRYDQLQPTNGLTQYEATVQAQTDQGAGNGLTEAGLGQPFIDAWEAAAEDPKFQQAQLDIRNQLYLTPAITYGTTDGVGTLGQFAYFDALVVHGDEPNGSGYRGFSEIRDKSMARAQTPAQGGDEKAYLEVFMEERIAFMQTEVAHNDVTRITDAQQVFLAAGNMNLDPPLNWSVYGSGYSITSNPTPYTPN